MDIRRIEPRKIVASYFCIQAMGTLAWWCLLWMRSDSIQWFQPEKWPQESLLSFFLADLIFLGLGSIATASAVYGERAWASTAVWLLVGAGWYPALYCIGVSVVTGEAWIASALMVTMAGLMLAMATIHGNVYHSPSAIRVVPMNGASAVLWTLFQIVIFWSVFLWIIPMGIAEFCRKIGWSTFAHNRQLECSLILLIVASLVGLWSAWTMAICGNGTPLPTATAPKLVLKGPYRFVRNPMALTGVLQGVAAGWMLGCWPIISGAFICSFAWHFVVRPVEEADLRDRFGESYANYQRQVGLWWPRFPKVPI